MASYGSVDVQYSHCLYITGSSCIVRRIHPASSDGRFVERLFPSYGPLAPLDDDGGGSVGTVTKYFVFVVSFLAICSGKNMSQQ